MTQKIRILSREGRPWYRSALFAVAALALFAATPPEGQARERIVRCRVVSGGTIAVDGKCLFDAVEDGSFHLGNVDGSKPLFDEVLLLNVAVVARDVAQVRGLTKAGINSMWGEAHRSARDRACWDGSDFRICAY